MKYCRRFIFMLLSLMLLASANASTNLPRNLTASDQVRALELLGFGSSGKILADPYPLGGYSGVEVGLSTQFIPIGDLASLGSTTDNKGELSYYSLTMGKGLFYNVDAFVYFTPAIQSEEMQSFGGQVRWGFYEANFFPISFSAMVYLGGANFQNLINVQTTGLDLIATVNMDQMALYFGGGRIRAQGTFIGGANGITASHNTEKQDVIEDHSFFGVSIGFAKMFLALEVDRYSDSVYSGKLGFRF
ncbi:MAG: hypothetical protein ACKOX6_06270 [Bdellovibrio sp.]